MPKQPCLVVPLVNVEVARRMLIELNALDRTFSPERVGDALALPIREEVVLANGAFQHRIEEIEVRLAPPSIDPYNQLKETLIPMIGSNKDLIQTIPKKWERLDDLVLFPKDAFLGDKWNQVIQEHSDFFDRIAEAMNAKRIGRQQPISDDLMRTSQVEILLGTDGWVEVRDNGLIYGFDASKVMYSSGNVTERHRMANVEAEGEVVIDAYAGIGYYTMQLLVHADVAHVHACEMNPSSIHAMEWSARENNVRSRLTVHAGDNEITLQKLEGTADRVLLGYLPSSEATWHPAIRALRESGGTLHIHMNVEEERIEDWCQETLEQCLQYAMDEGRNWVVRHHNVEKVKWYAPRIRHVVLDVSFSSISSAS